MNPLITPKLWCLLFVICFCIVSHTSVVFFWWAPSNGKIVYLLKDKKFFVISCLLDMYTLGSSCHALPDLVCFFWSNDKAHECNFISFVFDENIVDMLVLKAQWLGGISLECPLDRNYTSFENLCYIHTVDQPVMELVVTFHVEWDCHDCWWCFCKCIGNGRSKGDETFRCSTNSPDKLLCCGCPMHAA